VTAKMISLDDLMSEMGSPNKNQNDSSSSESREGKVYTVDDLDGLMADLETMESRRRAPMTHEVKTMGARKTASRKQATGALDDHDLDNVLDTILQAASKNLAQKKNEIGWGVINVERKFDLRAPEATQLSFPCISTIIVTTQTGERQRIDMKQIAVQVIQNGKTVLKHTLTDKRDGTYELVFTPTELGKVVLNIDTYGTRTFEFPIAIGGIADPSKCEAYVDGKARANQPAVIRIIAKDKRGERFKVGGTIFTIGFAGDGELYNVDLADQMDGSYILLVTPNKPGNYVVFISVGEVDISSSPLAFQVTG